MNRPAPTLAGLVAVAGLALLAPALAPTTGAGAATAGARGLHVHRSPAPRFEGAADLLAAEQAMRRAVGRGAIRHVEFDPDDESGLAVELELVSGGRSRLVELRRYEGDTWRVVDVTRRETSVRSRRYFERLVGVLEAEPHLGPGEAALRAESAHPGSTAVEVDLLLTAGEPVYEVELVLGTDSFDVHVPARVVAEGPGPASPPTCDYACLVRAVEASAREGVPFSFRSRPGPDGLVHEVHVADETGRTRTVRHASGTALPLGVEPFGEPAPETVPPAGALAEALRTLERILDAAGTVPTAMTAGDLVPARGDDAPAWRLRAWTPTAAGVLEVEVDRATDEIVLRLAARRAGT